MNTLLKEIHPSRVQTSNSWRFWVREWKFTETYICFLFSQNFILLVIADYFAGKTPGKILWDNPEVSKAFVTSWVHEREIKVLATLLSFTVFSSQQFKLTNTILTVGSPGALSILTLKAPETKEGFSSTPSEVHLSANHCNCGRICLHEFLLSAVRTMLMCYALL